MLTNDNVFLALMRGFVLLVRKGVVNSIYLYGKIELESGAVIFFFSFFSENFMINTLEIGRAS